MTPIRVEDLPEGHIEKPYNPVEYKGYCDLCNWSSAFEGHYRFWLCPDHARELDKLW